MTVSLLSTLLLISFPSLLVLSATEAPQNFVMFIVSLSVFFYSSFIKSGSDADFMASLTAITIGAAMFFESSVLL